MSPPQLPIDLNLAIAHGLRPDWFMRDRLGKTPDIWQEQLLRSRSKQVIINAGRQIGKSTVGEQPSSSSIAQTIHITYQNPAFLRSFLAV